ncbi:MAG: helix-turn-helix domain-containing protein [Bacteriovoracaceae bacterium]|nr:helix-turn-helix domain-containing protein [Bacteriovoracaceae bacterium]
MSKKSKGRSFDKYLKSKMKDSEISLAFEEVSIHLKIAKLIETLRLKEGLTQTQLAKKANVSQPMIARLEKGDQDRVPTLATINKVLFALGYEADLIIKKAA